MKSHALSLPVVEGSKSVLGSRGEAMLHALIKWMSSNGNVIFYVCGFFVNFCKGICFWKNLGVVGKSLVLLFAVDYSYFSLFVFFGCQSVALLAKIAK